MLGDDVLFGLGFVFDMVMVGLFIIFGLLIVKIVFLLVIFGSIVWVNIYSKSILLRVLEYDWFEDVFDFLNLNLDLDSEEDMVIWGEWDGNLGLF